MPPAKSDFLNDQRITLSKPPDARTPELARRYSMLRDGMTVQEALQALTARGLRGRGRAKVDQENDRARVHCGDFRARASSITVLEMREHGAPNRF